MRGSEHAGNAVQSYTDSMQQKCCYNILTGIGIHPQWTMGTDLLIAQLAHSATVAVADSAAGLEVEGSMSEVFLGGI